jgi:adenylate kinase family enzyme
MDKTNSIMILGKPNSGKTVYSAQLYGRLTRGVGQQITIRNTPENLDIFQEALES